MEHDPMACHDVWQQLDAFRDGTLDDTRLVMVRQHLAACQDCRSKLEGMWSLEDCLRTTFRDEPVPATLWSRISADLESMRSSMAPAEQTRRAFPWAWAVMAAMVLLALLGGALLTSSLFAPQSLAVRLLSTPVQDLHTFVVSQRALDITSPDPQRLRQWFQGKIDFSPPLLPRQAGTATLVGGRLCYFLDRRVASFMYTDDGRYLSLYVMSRQGLPPLPQERVEVAHPQARVYAIRGYTHVIWFHTDLLYSLVSDLPQARLLELVRGLVPAG